MGQQGCRPTEVGQVVGEDSGGPAQLLIPSTVMPGLDHSSHGLPLFFFCLGQEVPSRIVG